VGVERVVDGRLARQPQDFVIFQHRLETDAARADILVQLEDGQTRGRRARRRGLHESHGGDERQRTHALVVAVPPLVGISDGVVHIFTARVTYLYCGDDGTR